MNVGMLQGGALVLGPILWTQTTCQRKQKELPRRDEKVRTIEKESIVAIESNEKVVVDDTGDGDNKATGKIKRRQVTRSVDLHRSPTKGKKKSTTEDGEGKDG